MKTEEDQRFQEFRKNILDQFNQQKLYEKFNVEELCSKAETKLMSEIDNKWDNNKPGNKELSLMKKQLNKAIENRYKQKLSQKLYQNFLKQQIVLYKHQLKQANLEAKNSIKTLQSHIKKRIPQILNKLNQVFKNIQNKFQPQETRPFLEFEQIKTQFNYLFQETQQIAQKQTKLIDKRFQQLQACGQKIKQSQYHLLQFQKQTEKLQKLMPILKQNKEYFKKAADSLHIALKLIQEYKKQYPFAKFTECLEGSIFFQQIQRKPEETLIVKIQQVLRASQQNIQAIRYYNEKALSSMYADIKQKDKDLKAIQQISTEAGTQINESNEQDLDSGFPFDSQAIVSQISQQNLIRKMNDRHKLRRQKMVNALNYNH